MQGLASTHRIVCSFRTLLTDPDGVYDPTDYNDRLLLGLTGIMSEAELHVLRNRMRQGLLNKVRAGKSSTSHRLGTFGHPTAGTTSTRTSKPAKSSGWCLTSSSAWERPGRSFNT